MGLHFSASWTKIKYCTLYWLQDFLLLLSCNYTLRRRQLGEFALSLKLFEDHFKGPGFHSSPLLAPHFWFSVIGHRVYAFFVFLKNDHLFPNSAPKSECLEAFRFMKIPNKSSKGFCYFHTHYLEGSIFLTMKTLFYYYYCCCYCYYFGGEPWFCGTED